MLKNMFWRGVLVCAVLLGLVLLVVFSGGALGTKEVRLGVHDSFSLPKHVIEKFEKEQGARVVIVKLGDGQAMLNRLILTKAAPVVDAVFGIDNNTVDKAFQAGILAKEQPASQPTEMVLTRVLPIDFGFVTLNYDKAWFDKNNVPLPQSLDDLAQEAYKNLLVIPNPSTSTTGLAFLLANIAGMGEEKAFEWWANMRKNGVKVTNGWSDAYYTQFSVNGGAYPIMVGYASSPVAEVFYSEGKLSEPNMGNLLLPAGTYVQIEGAAVIDGAKEPKLAALLVQHLQSEIAQSEIMTSMWMYPAVKNISRPAIADHVTIPQQYEELDAREVHQNQQKWVSRWVSVVLK